MNDSSGMLCMIPQRNHQDHITVYSMAPLSERSSLMIDSDLCTAGPLLAEAHLA
jgi:hypothetical protein